MVKQLVNMHADHMPNMSLDDEILSTAEISELMRISIDNHCSHQDAMGSIEYLTKYIARHSTVVDRKEGNDGLYPLARYLLLHATAPLD
jgi:hypothetical protein